MKIFFTILCLLIASISINAQTTQPVPTPTDEDDVVKISTSLVQVDAVVTDKKGNPVTDLTANDIEITQDGKPQSVISFSYINTETRKPIQSVVTKKLDKNAPLPPPVVSNSSELGRILTFVVDDGNCVVTRIGMKAAREGLEKFVNEQMQPNDLVAIYQTRKGSSLLQQYTSDKSRLLTVIRKITWYPPGGACSISGDFYAPGKNDSTGRKNGLQTFQSDRDLQNVEAADKFNRDRQTVGAIGVIRFAINGLQRIGGRKMLFLLSDGLPISDGKGTLFDSFSNVRDLMESANRASVVINSIDIRGLPAPGAQAVDDVPSGDAVYTARRTYDESRQSGLAYAAGETGGKFYKDSNFIDYPIQQILKSEKGYYLIGYQPEEETFKGKKFHKIEIKLKRPDLIVSSRAGFSGITDKEIRPKPRTGDSELYEAIVAPLPNAGLDLHVTAFFANTATEGSYVRALLYLDGRQLTFTDEPNQMKKVVFDVIAVTLDEKNQVADEFNKTYTLRFPAANLATIQENGLIYSTDIPVKKAGSYNFRVAVRDVSSRLLGSAGQQIDIPDLKKGKMYSSGLTVGEVVIKDGKPVTPSIEKAADGFALVPATSIPAIRQFRPGSIIGYSYKIYNAQLDKTTQQPKLSTQVLLYRNGQVTLDSKPQSAQLDPQADLTRIGDYGYLKLPTEIQLGDYALQIVVKDLQSNETTSQWIDFEIVK